MDIQEIFSLEFVATANLPYTTKWTSNNDAEALLYIAGSARAHDSAGWFGFNVKVDGKQVANPASFSNDIGTSRPLVAEVAKIPSGRGEHTLTLEAMNGRTRVDRLDYACGTVFYRGFIEPFLWRFKGPLPQTKTFKSLASGIPGVVFLAGSGFVKNPVKLMGLRVELDGQEVVKSQIYPPSADYHTVFPPQFMPVTLKMREYKVTVAATEGVVTDENDVFEVAIFY